MVSVRDQIGGGEPPKGGGGIFGLKWHIFGAEGAENLFFDAGGAKKWLKWHIFGATGAEIFENCHVFRKILSILEKSRILLHKNT